MTNIVLQKKLEFDFVKLATDSGLILEKDSGRQFGASEFVNYLTIGGGLVAWISCLIQFLEVKKGARTLKVVKSNGETIEVSGMSKEEIIQYVKIGEKILLEEVFDEEE